MSTIDVGIIFDVSSSIKKLFNLFDESEIEIDGMGILTILYMICLRGESANNEKIRIFSILSGEQNSEAYDFGDIIKNINNQLNEPKNEDNEDDGNDEDDELDFAFDILGPAVDKVLKGVASGSSIDNIINDCVNALPSEMTIRKSENKIQTVKFLDGNDLLNIYKNVKDKLENNWKKLLNFKLDIDLVNEHLFGNDSLETSINLALNTFKEKSKNNFNFLFIISCGKEYTEKNNEFIKKINNDKDNDVIIMTFFLTEKKLQKEKQLYDENMNYSNENGKFLFNLSTLLENSDPFIKFLSKENWDIPKNGLTKLFFEMNGIQNFYSFIDLFNQIISGLKNLSLNDIAGTDNDNQTSSLINIITDTVIDSMTQELIDEFKAVKQEGPTCYANAIAVGLFMLSDKILEKKYDYKKIRNRVIEKKSQYRKGNTFKILNMFLDKYKETFKIKCKKVCEEDARKAVIDTRPCIVRFGLTKKQWEIFDEFYKNNPKGVLTKDIINVDNTDSKKKGHAAVLTHIETDGCLKILNSYGSQWGDEGYFRVKNGDVLDMQFCEIFYDFSVLGDKEKKKFNNWMKNVEGFIKEIFFE